MTDKAPGSVAIVAAGLSHREYVSECAVRGGRRGLVDETWTVNAMAGVLAHDRAFMMDSPATVAAKIAAGDANPEEDCSSWLRGHPGPVYAPATDPRFPGIVAYPLEDAVNLLAGETYINSTIAYAVVFARLIGVPHLRLYGCDFTYPNLHTAEKGRACVEYHLEKCRAAGMAVTVARTSTLMDTDVGRPLYGYDRPIVVNHDGNRFRVKEI